MNTLPEEIEDALSYERLNYVHGSCREDSFYDIPAGFANAQPGTLLKVEKDTDTSNYLIPPALAISRLLYQSETLSGHFVPVSAIILFPYSASRIYDRCPVVAWAHGTSGITPDSAPSHLKNLSQHYLAPFQIALQGYVVVATDYAGLGVGIGHSRENIVHEYLCGTSHANDVIYAVEAAQAAFPELTKEFVVIGHSQGGGAAWACAQRQACKPVQGYLGAIAVSPFTNVLDEPGRSAAWYGLHICHTAAAVNSDLDLSSVLTEPSMHFFQTIRQSNAGVECARALFTSLKGSRATLLKTRWKENKDVRSFQDQASNGGKPIDGPLLVIHGENDPALHISLVSKAVEDTVKLCPANQITYIILPQVTHNPALPASQSIWMKWIADKFSAVEATSAYEMMKVGPMRPATAYHKEQNWYLETATMFYHAAGEIRPAGVSKQHL